MATMGGQESPGSVSRTARYRKVTKPLLERRRRARINRCLDELKDLMVGALEVERENISKLEKADILELTVRHLSKLRGPRDHKAEVERFQAGFGHCASEAYHFILSSPGVDSAITQQLVRHLSSQMNDNPLGPLALPALASPVQSDSSLSPGTSSRGSPNYYEQRPAPSSIGSPVSYERPRPAWKDESPRVPVEQSLTCDVATHNLRPVITRQSEPMTGLLMTVNSDYPSRNPTEIYNKQRERQRTPEIKERFDIRGAQTAEAKNLIMQKIREHILERQHREPDPRDTQQRPPRSYGAPHDISQRPGTYPTTNHLPDPNQFSASKDIYPKEIAQRPMKRERSPNVHEEAINLSSVSAAKKSCNEIHARQKSESPDSADVYFKTKKQQADYKSIHPKKVMIRIPKGSAEHESGESSRGHNRAGESQISSYKDQREPNIANAQLEKQSDDSDISIAEAYYMRYREQNKDRQQLQDDEDNVSAWRPW